MRFRDLTLTTLFANGPAIMAITFVLCFAASSALAQDKKGTVTTTWKDASIEVVDGVKGEKPAADGSVAVAPGKYTVIVRRPGFFPVKGTVDVAAGKTHTITFNEEAVPQRRQGEIWSLIGIGVGVSAVLTAAALELADVKETLEMSALKGTLAGVGSIMFTTGGACLHWIRTSRSNPAVKEQQFQINVGAAPMRGGAMLSAGARF
ncbi:MAG: hypothetical protein VX223_18490 [Myxococcota bacterium]|nr:hypothetical protein [Myxococcota bacterium]